MGTCRYSSAEPPSDFLNRRYFPPVSGFAHFLKVTNKWWRYKISISLAEKRDKRRIRRSPLHLTNHAEAGKQEIEGGDRLIAPYDIPPKLTKKRYKEMMDSIAP